MGCVREQTHQECDSTKDSIDQTYSALGQKLIHKSRKRGLRIDKSLSTRKIK